MMQAPDTSRTIVIEGSPGKLVLLSVLGVVMTGASLLVALVPSFRGIQSFGQRTGSPLACPREGGGGDELKSAAPIQLETP
jgi:hypothetical protein